MKKLFFFALLVLPVVLYSAVPTCLDGMEVSLLDSKGKVVKSGKFDSKGELTLDGLGDAVYTIRISNNGKTCVVNKPVSGEFSGLPTGKRMHKPIVFSLNAQEGGNQIWSPKSNMSKDEQSGMATGKKSSRDAASGLATGRRMHKPTSEGMDQDCDDVEFSVVSMGSGKATFKEFTVSK